MIWVGGRVVPDDALTISALDRTFEHGLGLFETLRTWDGRPVLLSRHLERLTRSAQALRLPVDPTSLPNTDAVAALLDAEGVVGDAMLRITLTGGQSEDAGAMLWMRQLPLPPPIRDGGAIVVYGSWEVARFDPLARHKTLNYWLRRMAYEKVRALGFDEVLSMTPGCYWEGSRTNLFIVKNGALITPSLDGPIVPGVMRGLVLEAARRDLSLKVHEETDLARPMLRAAHEVFLTNSVRGIIPVAKAGHFEWREPWTEWPAPGPWTRRLSQSLAEWLQPGGPIE